MGKQSIGQYEKNVPSYSYLRKCKLKQVFPQMYKNKKLINNVWHGYGKEGFSYTDGIIEVAVKEQFCTIKILKEHSSI